MKKKSKQEFSDSQLILDFSKTLPPKPVLARDIKFGETFLHNHNYLIRVKPVNYLLNSSLVQDCMLRGRILVVNLEKATLYYVDGDKEVVRVRVTTKIEEILR